MKRVMIIGKPGREFSALKKKILSAGLHYDETNPEVVVSYGGDGTYLVAERSFPGIPKLLVRDSKICNKCHNKPDEHVFGAVAKNEYAVHDHIKLEAAIGKEKLIATNDFVIRNKFPTHAIRFSLKIDGKQLHGEIIGDGIVVSTAFGSTGYYFSVSRSTFEKGIGVAFNNTTQHLKPLELKEDQEITLTLTRGDAVLVSDNDPTVIELKEGEKVTIKKSKNVAKIIVV